MADPVIIRAARPAEARDLEALVVRSKSHWPYPPAFLARFARSIGLTAEVVAANDVQVAERGGAVIGFYTLLHRGALVVLDDLWLEPAEIGRGSGRLLFGHAVARAAAAGAAVLEWESDPHAAGFYERMGAVRIGWADSPHGLRQPVWRMVLTAAR